MSIYMEVSGAIRICPAVEPALAERLNRFLVLRHMRRDVERLCELYPSEEERKSHSLLEDGNFGPEGVYFMPAESEEASLADYEKLPGLRGQGDVNKPPEGGSSLYCPLWILPGAAGEDCSYLAWNEDGYYRDFGKWVKLVAQLLVSRGYHMDGRLVINVENGWKFHLIAVHDADVTEEEHEGGSYLAELWKAVDQWKKDHPEEDEG